MFLCIVMPGVSMAGFAYAGFLWVESTSGSEAFITGVILGLFAALVVVSCWFAGILVAAKSGAVNRRREVIRTGIGFFLLQLFLAPAIGWGTCLTFVSIFNY